MSRIIKAKVVTNASDDKYARVKISLPGLWEESELTESVGMLPLKKGDWVYVDAHEPMNPIILGRAAFEGVNYGNGIEGSLLFESSDGTNWTIAYVKNNKLVVETSNGSSITVDGNDIDVHGAVKVTGTSLEVKGNVVLGESGPFCGLKACAFTGAQHVGEKVILNG